MKFRAEAVVEEAGMQHLLLECLHNAVESYECALARSAGGIFGAILSLMACCVFSYLVMLNQCKTDKFSGISGARAHVENEENKNGHRLKSHSSHQHKGSAKK